jgi:uridine kinase
MSDAHLDEQPGHMPFVLGIIGDSGSGKRTMAAGVRTLLGDDRVSVLALDDYLRYTRSERLELGLTAHNPSVHNLSLMQEHLHLFRRGRPVRMRSYDHSDGTFGPLRTVEPNEVVVVRGLLGFPNEEMRSEYDLAVFLQPEPELLFRWKLRRDVKVRGYSEAGVLKLIANYLLDSKQYVTPQADRADLVVRYDVPEWDAPDTEVRATIVLRRDAAEAVRTNGVCQRFGGEVCVEEEGGELVVRVPPGLPLEAVDEWAAERFPDTFQPGTTGRFMMEDGEEGRLLPLAFTQVLIADLTQKLRRRIGAGQQEPVRVAI